MAPLDSVLRNTLENQVIKARDVSEAGAHTALRALAVHEREARNHMTTDQRALRRALRAKARQLGDPLERDTNSPMPALERELAYERWHQMLFAAFLAHNNLLLHPIENVPVTLHDCHEIAHDEGDHDGWQTAARYASHMLPGIFKPTGPLLQVRYAPEDHHALERILNDIPPPTYTSDDGLGWVYQFWQTKRKKQVNESGRKIGGADIAPVTQLFTEHFMVQFLLHNTLGAWWTAHHPDTPLPTGKSYLRTLDDGTPAAGTFDGWPNAARDITVMDPCCGSGHFLIAAFALLQRFRMIEEGLSEAEAGDAVLRANLHGLELDPRCTQLAAFNLALYAWKHGGYRPLPPMNIACSGIPAGGTVEDWTNLSDDPRAKNAVKQLHLLFKNAPDLGSLIDPNRLAEDDPLYTANYGEIEALLDKALTTTDQSDPAANIFGQAARGIAHAARLLTNKYTLVTTNVPYLGRAKQSDILRAYIDEFYSDGRADLATAFVQRCSAYSRVAGVIALVTPNAWLQIGRYRKLRRSILESTSLNIIAALGPGAFSAITGEVVNPVLLVATSTAPHPEHGYCGLDLSVCTTIQAKLRGISELSLSSTRQRAVLDSVDARIILEDRSMEPILLLDYAAGLGGITTSDSDRFRRQHWEVVSLLPGWHRQQGAPQETISYAGRDKLLLWANGTGELALLADQGPATIAGRAAWGNMGIAVRVSGTLHATVYSGDVYENVCAVLLPKEQDHLLPILAYASSSDFNRDVRRIDSKIGVTCNTLVKVPFDLDHWQAIAAEKYPHGLPKPYSDDPTQWLFHGHPVPAREPLQVAVARLLGYRWPAETDADMELSDEARTWIKRSQELLHHADKDGIVCLPPVAGEKPGAERLRTLLASAYGDQWSPTTEAALLANVDYDGKTLREWLTGDYFKQHCKTFNKRPFIWHISDGTKDGFSALVNYHRLDRALLERLIYTYLGSYIRQQHDAANNNTRGADIKLAKAEELKTKLEHILEGEDPYDIFIRWKPLDQQPIGWEPDLNDGVRLNIRPFFTAGVLRNRFTIHWRKDRGNDPTPNVTGATERHNDKHLKLAEKRAARAAVTP